MPAVASAQVAPGERAASGWSLAAPACLGSSAGRVGRNNGLRHDFAARKSCGCDSAAAGAPRHFAHRASSPFQPGGSVLTSVCGREGASRVACGASSRQSRALEAMCVRRCEICDAGGAYGPGAELEIEFLGLPRWHRLVHLCFEDAAMSGLALHARYGLFGARSAVLARGRRRRQDSAGAHRRCCSLSSRVLPGGGGRSGRGGDVRRQRGELSRSIASRTHAAALGAWEGDGVGRTLLRAARSTFPHAGQP